MNTAPAPSAAAASTFLISTSRPALGGAHPTIAQATVVEQSASQTVIALTGTGLSHLMRGKAGTYSLIFHLGKSDPMTYTVTIKD